MPRLEQMQRGPWWGGRSPCQAQQGRRGHDIGGLRSPPAGLAAAGRGGPTQHHPRVRRKGQGTGWLRHLPPSWVQSRPHQDPPADPQCWGVEGVDPTHNLGSWGTERPPRLKPPSQCRLTWSGEGKVPSRRPGPQPYRAAGAQPQGSGAGSAAGFRRRTPRRGRLLWGRGQAWLPGQPSSPDPGGPSAAARPTQEWAPWAQGARCLLSGQASGRECSGAGRGRPSRTGRERGRDTPGAGRRPAPGP